MTCLMQMDQSPGQVLRPVLGCSEAPIGVVKAVQIFAVLVELWCLLEPFAWFEL